jgi:ribose transport system substrate-binding protein
MALRRGAPVACAVVILGCIVAGCGSSGSSSTVQSSTSASSSAPSAAANPLQGKMIADLNTVPNAFTTCFQKQYLPALAASGAKTFALYGGFLPASLEQSTQEVITRGAQVAIYTAEAPVLDTNTLKKLANASIKTVLLEGTPPAGTTPQAYLQYPYSTFGSDTAAELAKLMPTAKVVGLVDGEAGNPENDNTDSAVEAGLKARGISVAGIEHGDFTSTGGATATQDLLQAHPNVQVIISFGDDMSLAAARVVKSEGRNIPIVDIYAFSDGALNEVKNGQMLFVLWEPVKTWGDDVVKAVRAVLEGQSIPPQTLGLSVVSKSNVGSLTSAC